MGIYIVPKYSIVCKPTKFDSDLIEGKSPGYRKRGLEFGGQQANRNMGFDWFAWGLIFRKI